jgi:oligoendopeptidase F
LFNSLPTGPAEIESISWNQIEPYFQDLYERKLTAENIESWLADWTRLDDLVSDCYARLNVAVTVDTTDERAETVFNNFLNQILPHYRAWDQKLKAKLLASGLHPEGFDIPLKRMQTEASIFCEENLPLLSQERKLGAEYNRIIGAQTVIWQGEEKTLLQLRAVAQNPDRSVREQVWRLIAARQLEDRQAINALWTRMLRLRQELARNAGKPDYRAYRWKQMLRLDYTPEDCLQFHRAIEEVAVPAATRIYEKHRRRLGVDRLRPWDLDLDLYPIHIPALPSYGSIEVLVNTAGQIFRRLDPQLGEYFQVMQSERLLDLENRKGKAPGGYCTAFPVSKRPFIFMNAVGLPADVRTLLHEAGHAFHNFERFQLPFAAQRSPGLEFSEVASMSMELLTAPYLSEEQGGFYSPKDAKSAQIVQLEHLLIFWPYMAVVDAFQHWVYQHPDLASDPSNCDAKWLELWNRFIPGVDWSGLEDEAMTGWHRKQHIHRSPFYYVEYGLAQLGSVQVWANALQDPARALRQYRAALRLGGTVSLPELYAAAGAKFAFDVETLQPAVTLVENTIAELENSPIKHQ